MKGIMRQLYFIIIILILIPISFYSCNESSTESIEDNSLKLILSADKLTGESPLTVNFTGTFSGKIDTVQMKVPSYFMFPGTGKTVITYSLPDSIVPAEKKYNTYYVYGTGTYKAVMMVQSKFRNYYSDTLSIVVK